MRIAGAGRLVFAATLVALGIWGLATGHFGAIWQPVPKSAPAREVLAYVCAGVALASGAGLLWRRTATWAARLLLVFLLVWMAWIKGRAIVLEPTVAASWESLAESVVVVAAAWVLYAEFAGKWDRRRLGFATGDKGLRIARTLYGLAMIVFGVAHLAYIKLTASLVPGWLPSHVAWVYLTAATYIAAGAAIVTGVFARLAAALSVLQMGLFTLLVWAPPLAAGSKDPSVWSEGVVSWALTAAGWVVADSYRGGLWAGIRKR
jgi:uncharacterized membrane protein